MLELNNTQQTKLLNLNNLPTDLKSTDNDKLILQLKPLLIQVISDSYKRVFTDYYYTKQINELLLCKSIFFGYNIRERSFKFITVTTKELKDLDDDSIFVPVALENKISTTKKWTQILSEESDTDTAINKIAKAVLKLGKSRMRRMLSLFSKELLSGNFSHIRLTELIGNNPVDEPFALQTNIGYLSPKLFTFQEIIQIAVKEANSNDSFVDNFWEYIYHYYFNNDADELFNNVLKLKIYDFNYALRFMQDDRSTLTDNLFNKFKEFLEKVQLSDIIKLMQMNFTDSQMIMEYIFKKYSIDDLKQYVKHLIPNISSSLNLDFTKWWNIVSDYLLNDKNVDEYVREQVLNIDSFVITEYNFTLDDVYSSVYLQDGKVLNINSLQNLVTKPFVINKKKVLQYVNKYIDKMPKLPYFNDMRQLLIELKQKLVSDEIKEFPFEKLSLELYKDKIESRDDFEKVYKKDDSKRMVDYAIVAK